MGSSIGKTRAIAKDTEALDQTVVDNANVHLVKFDSFTLNQELYGTKLYDHKDPTKHTGYTGFQSSVGKHSNREMNLVKSTPITLSDIIQEAIRKSCTKSGQWCNGSYIDYFEKSTNRQLVAIDSNDKQYAIADIDTVLSPNGQDGSNGPKVYRFKQLEFSYTCFDVDMADNYWRDEGHKAEMLAKLRR